MNPINQLRDEKPTMREYDEVQTHSAALAVGAHTRTVLTHARLAAEQATRALHGIAAMLAHRSPSHDLVVAADAIHARLEDMDGDNTRPTWELLDRYKQARARHAEGAKPSGAPAPASATTQTCAWSNDEATIDGEKPPASAQGAKASGVPSWVCFKCAHENKVAHSWCGNCGQKRGAPAPLSPGHHRCLKPGCDVIDTPTSGHTHGVEGEAHQVILGAPAPASAQGCAVPGCTYLASMGDGCHKHPFASAQGEVCEKPDAASPVKPCPSCGCTVVKVSKYGEAVCMGIDCTLRADSVDEWNRRTPAPSPATGESARMTTREREEILKNDEIALAIADGMARCADVFCDQAQPDRRREAARMTHKRLAETRELLAALRAERARRYAHMCRSEHVEIGFNDCVPDQPDELNCPVCFLRAEVERLRAENTGYREAIDSCADAKKLRAEGDRLCALTRDGVGDEPDEQAHACYSFVANVGLFLDSLRAAECIDVVFDGPPSHESGRFVEVEDMQGRSINAGEWIDRKDGFWALRLRASQARGVDVEAVVRSVFSAMDSAGYQNAFYVRDAIEKALRTALAEKEGDHA